MARRKMRQTTVCFLISAVLAGTLPLAVRAQDILLRGSRTSEQKSEEKKEPEELEEADMPEQKEADDKVEEEISEESVEYGTPEDGKPYDFTGIVPKDEPPEDFDRYKYDPMADERESRAIENYEELRADIAKRAEWVDKDNGNGKITLMYSSNSGSYSGSEDINVIFVQDKSGSMDPNYGFNIALVDYSLNVNGASHWYVPIRNNQGYTESSADCIGTEYRNQLNVSSTGVFWGNMMWHEEMAWNSPCQQSGHYYQMIEGDSNSPSIRAGQMVHGNLLYNISHTDLHHYVMLGSRDEALSYLAGGRRVIRCSDWVNENKSNGKTEKYFLDMTQVYSFQGRQVLRTCGDSCEGTAGSRLAKSQWFMDKLAADVKRLNPSNKMAYVPFWGDVPVNGSWSNASSNGSTTNLYADNNDQPGARRQTYKAGVTSIGLTSAADSQTIVNQINNPFTYAGTNWSRAFQKTLDILNGRSQEDKQKKSLIIFLTDGKPQGTAGKATDVDNPYINGVNQVKSLKGISGVTLYACGVGINKDDNSVIPRIQSVDSRGSAHFATYVHEFDGLYQEVSKRLNEDFYIPITGQESFYTDRLSGDFSLDEAALDGSWKVLAAPGSGSTKGVPSDVYNAVKNNASVTHIYVRSTKTVYWYIGAMTDGNYETKGHQFSFPVKYSGYNSSTGGKDSTRQANTEQKLTYVSSANQNNLRSVTLNTPSLVFHREDLPVLTVRKVLEGSHFTADRTYQFAYCKNRQSGKVVSREGTAAVTVKAGEKEAETSVKDVKPGTYYVYEVDENGAIISAQEETITVAMTPAITTREKSETVPSSAETTDGQNLKNSNNYLQIVRTNAEVSFTTVYISVQVEKKWDDSGFSGRPTEITVHLLKNGTKTASQAVKKEMEWKCVFENLERYDAAGKEIQYTVSEDEIKNYKEDIRYRMEGNIKQAEITNQLMSANLTVTKTIPADDDVIWWEHGNPTFPIRVSGIGLDGERYTFYHTFVFTKEDVTEHTSDGAVTLSYTFREIPNSTAYRCEELTVSRWRLEAVRGNGKNVTVTNGDTAEGAEVFGIYADVNLKERPENTEVIFQNVKDDYQWLNHTAFVHNVVRKKRIRSKRQMMEVRKEKGMKDEQSTEEFLGEMQRVFREREEEFQRREQVYREKNEKLQELFGKLAEQKQEQEALFLKQSLALEKVRNEEIKLKRLAEEYEYRLKSLEGAGTGGEAAGREPVFEENEEFVEKSCGYEDCENSVIARERGSYGQEQEQPLSPDYGAMIAGYKEEITALKEERTRLMKHILEMGENTKDGQAFAEPGKADIAQELWHESEAGELTAENFCTYLKKNEPGFASAVVYHSEAGEQVHVEGRGLTYRFLFAHPAYFDIFASRKDSPQLRRLLKRMNDSHPGVQFHYECGKIYATCYFKEDFTAGELINRAKELSACFRQEE